MVEEEESTSNLGKGLSIFKASVNRRREILVTNVGVSGKRRRNKY